MADLKTYKTTKEAVLNVHTPANTRTWRPVGHTQLIDTTLESIHQAGFILDKEEYSMAREGNIANGRYTIRNIADTDMQIQIGWQNSINKVLSLKYAIGVYIFICSNGAISGDMGAFKRKHQGDVQEFTPKYITEYIKTAGDVFVEMQKERDRMKEIEIDKRTRAEILGRLFFDEQLIESTQMNIIKRELDSPTYDYGAPNSVWETYQFVTYSLKELHPALYMDSHIATHKFFSSLSGIIAPNNNIIIPEPESPFKQLDWVEELTK